MWVLPLDGFITSRIHCAVFIYNIYTSVLLISFGYASLDDDNDAVPMETAVCIALRRQRGRTAWTQMSHDLKRQRVCTSEQSLCDVACLCVSLRRLLGLTWSYSYSMCRKMCRIFFFLKTTTTTTGITCTPGHKGMKNASGYTVKKHIKCNIMCCMSKCKCLPCAGKRLTLLQDRNGVAC